MDLLKWLLGSKEIISDKTLEHSSKGEFTKNSNRLKSGGHGQENINYMNKNNIEYNIVKEYNNGVRVGNVPRHIHFIKQNGINKSWFPKNWDRKKIKKAGQVVSRGTKLKDGQVKIGDYENVNVGIVRTNGKIATIFPMNIQKNKKGKILNERKINKKNNSRKKRN